MKIPRVYLEVTTLCNYRCTYCPHPTMQRPKVHMAWDLALEALRQIRDGGVGDHVWLDYLGEPLLYPRLFDLAEEAHALGLTTHVITNGSLLTTSVLEQLRTSRFSTIKVSHDSTFADTAAVHRAPRFTPAQVLASTGRLVEAVRGSGKRVVVILKTTLPGFEGGVDGVELISTPDALYREVQAILDELGRSVALPSLAQLKPALDALNWRSWNRELALAPGVGLEVRPTLSWGNLLTRGPVVPTQTGYCNALVEKVAILVNGDVVPCCVDAEGELALGNILEQPLAQLLAAEKARTLREGFAANRVVFERCQRCLGQPQPRPESSRLPVLAG